MPTPPNEPVYAGVDLGGTTVTCVLGSADGVLYSKQTIPTRGHQGPEAVLDRIADTVEALSDGLGRKPDGLGMAGPGLIDIEQGVTRFFPNLHTNWRDVRVADRLGGRLGCPVHLLNDVRAATLGELVYGHGREASTMAFFALGTGVGGGVVVDGKLRLGPLGAAGELGHQTILPDGPKCGCGNRGCLETLGSGPAITAAGVRLMLSGLAPRLHDLTEGDTGRVTPKEMAAAAREGDSSVEHALVRAARFIGIGVANVVVVLHPELIVLGGGVAQMGDLLFETVRDTLRERVGMFPTDGVVVKPSALGTDAGPLGAVALAAREGDV